MFWLLLWRYGPARTCKAGVSELDNIAHSSVQLSNHPWGEAMHNVSAHQLLQCLQSRLELLQPQTSKYQKSAKFLIHPNISHFSFLSNKAYSNNKFLFINKNKKSRSEISIKHEYLKFKQIKMIYYKSFRLNSKIPIAMMCIVGESRVIPTSIKLVLVVPSRRIMKSFSRIQVVLNWKF